ncbi:MAG TPA: hypothetical protein VHW44_04345 [Pseudonocardiaceae bacterium]|jgi:hypothetical protein|nr:hypothetical protein [Pseudonocardiaceae bacterium]
MGGYSAPDIYNRIRGGSGWGPLADNQGFTDGQQGLQDEINQKILTLNTKMDAAWQGDASTQAVSGARPLATATQTAGESLGTASSVMGDQVNAFTTAYNSVQPLSASPPANNAVNEFVSGFGVTTPLDNQISQYNNAASNNVQVYNNYNSASTANADAMPTEYGELPAATPSVSVESASISGGAGPAFAGSNGAYGTGGVGGDGYTGSSGAGYVAPGSGAGSTSGSGFTEPGGAGAGSGGAGGIRGEGGIGGVGNFGDGSTQTTGFPGGGGVFGEGGEGGEGGFGGLNGTLGGDESLLLGGGANRNSDDDEAALPGGGIGGGGLGGGPGAGGGPGGAGGAGGSGGAASGSGVSGSESAQGQGARSGLGMNPAAEEAMGRGMAAGAGEPGMGGGMNGRGQGKENEEDAEHKTAEYLQEADPDAIFGSDEMTVPPVIGE